MVVLGWCGIVVLRFEAGWMYCQTVRIRLIYEQCLREISISCVQKSLQSLNSSEEK